MTNTTSSQGSRRDANNLNDLNERWQLRHEPDEQKPKKKRKVKRDKKS